MQEHEEDYLWVEMLCKMKLYAVKSQTTSLADALSPVDSQPHINTELIQELKPQPQGPEPSSHIKSLSPSTGTNSTRPTFASALKTQPEPELKLSTRTS